MCIRDSLSGGGIAGQRLQVHQWLGARKAGSPQCPVHGRASGQPRPAGPHLDDHLPAVCQPEPRHSGQVASAEQLGCGRRAQPARAPIGQRIRTHGWAAGLGHNPILPKRPASDGLIDEGGAASDLAHLRLPGRLTYTETRFPDSL